jgi:hypothetical protein
LPAIVESLEIDGYTQPGAKPNSLADGSSDALILIQIDGHSKFVPNGLVLYGNGSNYVVKGLSLTSFRDAAITADAVNSAVVTGNFIGLLPDGETASGNGIGVGHVTQLGGSDPASRNVVSGNEIGFAGEAPPILGMTTAGAVVQRNYIGTNAKGTKPVPNFNGIALETEERGITNCVDKDVDLSKTVIDGNLITGNSSAIVLGRIECGFRLPTAAIRANGVQIKNNGIGWLYESFTPPVDGSGITIVAGSDNVMTGNGLTLNTSGIVITGGAGSVRNRMSMNGFSNNRSIGIDLGGDGPTPNDSGDSDSGPDNLQNYPVIASVTRGLAGRFPVYTVAGALNSTPNSTFRIEFFGGLHAGVSGSGDGGFVLGFTNVTTDASGHASFETTVGNSLELSVFGVTATDSSGNTSEFSPAFPPPTQLLNLSTRTPVGNDENVMIGGFIIVGSDNKTVLLRALGPSLGALGVSGALENPSLELYDGTGGLITYNHDWKDTQANEIQATRLAPTHNLEAAILASLPAKPATQGGATYTGILNGEGGGTGVGLFEIYDLAVAANAKLANISTRGFVGSGDALLIGGFIMGPTDGRSPIRLCIRGIGPSLGASGITAPLQDPVLELHNSNGAAIDSNDNWRASFDAPEIVASGLAPTDDRESVILRDWRPSDSGVTAVLRGVKGTTGVGLVEIYCLN